MIRRLSLLVICASLSGCGPMLAMLPAPSAATVAPKADSFALHRLIEAQTAFKVAQRSALACRTAGIPPCVTNWNRIADLNDRGVQLETAAVTAAHTANSGDVATLTVNFNALVGQLHSLGVPAL